MQVLNFKSPHSGLLGRLDSGCEANTGALLPMTPIQNKTSERIYNAVLFCLAVISLSIIPLSPLRSSAQSSDNSAQPTLPDDRARLDQAAPPGDAALADRENALRLAEDDLLKRLGSSLPSSGEVPAEPPIDPTQSFVVVQPAAGKPPAVAPSSVLSERLNVPSAPQAPVAANAARDLPPPSAQPSNPFVVVQAAATCAPCSLQAAPRKVTHTAPRKPSARPASRPTSIDSALGDDGFSPRGRTGSCEEGIDDPYVPTSQQARLTSSAPLRLAPGREESSLGRVARDSIVGIELRDGEWYRIVTQGGVRGWIAGKYLIFDIDVPPSSTVRVGAFNSSYEPTGIKF